MIGNDGDAEFNELILIKSGERGECWKYDVNKQFPIHHIEQNNDQVIVTVGAPHEGYSIESGITNDKLNGKSTIFNKFRLRVASLSFVNGVAEGKCLLYDEMGVLFFDGKLVNGFRSGVGAEYDEGGLLLYQGSFKDGIREGKGKEFHSNGKIKFIGYFSKGHREGKGKEFHSNGNIMFSGIFVDGHRQGKGKEYSVNGDFLGEGIFDNGVKVLTFAPFANFPPYWKETGLEEGKSMVCKLNDMGKRIGTGYLYNFDHISRISKWDNGCEAELLKEFNENSMTEYRKGVKRYTGEFINSLPDYLRNGVGMEFYSDGITMRYRGEFYKGKRHGHGIYYRNNRPVSNSLWIRGFPAWLFALCVEGTRIAVICGIFWVVYFFGFSLRIPLVFLVLYLWRLCSLVRCGLDFSIATHCLLKRKLLISDKSCRLRSTFDPSSSYFLRWIEVGSGCFNNVKSFRINGLNKLEMVRIGQSSFTDARYCKSVKRSFEIQNCCMLWSIIIDAFSFVDYDMFKLNYLPSLSTIKIGKIGSRPSYMTLYSGLSSNFYRSSFVVKDLPNLQSIELGDGAFEASVSTVISNLPNLKSIKLGWGALKGRDNDSCSLEMKDLPKLEEVTSNGNSFYSPRSVILSNIPNLKRANLLRSFEYVRSKSITNDVSTLLANLVKIKN